jgi:membrane associated rhomboid family serine protease
LLDQGEILHEGAISEALGLSSDGMAKGSYWQLLSFMLVHTEPFPVHVLLSLVVLYFAGREIEPIVGIRHLLGVFFSGNLMGGLAHWLAGVQGWVPPEISMVGISAGVMAVLASFATILPELEIPNVTTALIPFQVRAKFVGLGAAFAAAILWASDTYLPIGPEGMLAASGLGWFYMKRLGYGSPLALQRYIYDRRQRQARLARMPVEQFICEEIDPILDKIASSGIQSLTRSERRILEQCRAKMKSGQVVETGG